MFFSQQYVCNSFLQTYSKWITVKYHFYHSQHTLVPPTENSDTEGILEPLVYIILLDLYGPDVQHQSQRESLLSNIE